MNIDNFIESGILESYCMGLLDNEDRALVEDMALLHPVVKAELDRIEITLEKFAKLNAVEIENLQLKEKILASLDRKPQDELDLNNLPVIDDDTDYQVWLKWLNHLIFIGDDENIVFEPLLQGGNITQTLVISRVNVPPEVHTDILETLLILQGNCECTIGENVIMGSPGSVIKIPLNIEHDVKMTSPYVAAVVQHQRL